MKNSDYHCYSQLLCVHQYLLYTEQAVKWLPYTQIIAQVQILPQLNDLENLFRYWGAKYIISIDLKE